MLAQQKRTFLVYSRGLLPADLRLGSLYLDPANPLDGEHRRYESALTEADVRAWTGEPEIDSGIELAFTASQQWLINSGLFGLLKGELGRGRSHDIKISGLVGRRLQIKRPEAFLNKAVLQPESARTWLADQLSISRYLYYLHQSTFGLAKLPHIWVVTGIQYITDAEVVATQAQSRKMSSAANVPVPEPIAAAAVVLGGQGVVGVAAERSNDSQSTTAYRHDEERVWAAQFTRLSVRFSTKPAPAGELQAWVRLHDLDDLKSGGIRNGVQRPVPSLNEELAYLSVANESAEQAHGEDILDMMQDVDWASLDQLIKSATK